MHVLEDLMTGLWKPPPGVKQEVFLLSFFGPACSSLGCIATRAHAWQTCRSCLQSVQT